eukprot:Seg15250.2 transcript_id=Seg15250.2/GoldUCD/mRNA.D3Y31 product="tRNA Ile-lysidine synthase" protein_id=Seg15250.2/GoldUCD/D3Y31
MSLLDHKWLERAHQKRWLVAVSGGRDSVALLASCVEAGLENVVICHVNHSLRGEESDGDEQFVRGLADGYELPIHVVNVDVNEVSNREKKSIELAAREVRHVAYVAACERYQCGGVLLGHHADDQAETILFNLLRGSAGLRGMKAVSSMKVEGYEVELHRPMLNTRRSEIDAYIKRHDLDFREDSTNAEDFAVRNRMRNEVLPLLTDVMGREVTPAIIKAEKTTREQDAFINEMIDYSSLLDPQGRLHLPSLLDVPELIQKRVLHRYLIEQRVPNLSHELIESCMSILDIDAPAKVNLPSGIHLRRRQQRIFVER